MSRDYKPTALDSELNELDEQHVIRRKQLKQAVDRATTSKETLRSGSKKGVEPDVVVALKRYRERRQPVRKPEPELNTNEAEEETSENKPEPVSSGLDKALNKAGEFLIEFVDGVYIIYKEGDNWRRQDNNIQVVCFDT